jgi:hypothetical protein
MAKSTDTAGGNLGRLASAAGSRNMGGAKPKRLVAKKTAPAKKVAKKSGSTSSRVKKTREYEVSDIGEFYSRTRKTASKSKKSNFNINEEDYPYPIKEGYGFRDITRKTAIKKRNTKRGK